MDYELEGSLVSLLGVISANAAFTSDDEYSEIWTFAEAILPDIKNKANQKQVEEQIFKQLSKNYIDMVGSELETVGTVKSIELLSGSMEFAQVTQEQQFSTSSLNYPENVRNELTGGSGSAVVVNLKVIDSNKLPMKESSATLETNPIAIENYVYSGGEGTSDSVTSTLSEPFTLCFNEAAEIDIPVCVYWDDEKSMWSQEGVTTAAGGCCESLHFSTFGVISPSSEQIIPIENSNPGEYYNNNLCQTQIAGCLECLFETGECVLCEGYSPLIDGQCICQQGKVRYYDSSSFAWMCKEITELVVPEISFECSEASQILLLQLKSAVYSVVDDDSQILAFLSQLQQCETNFEEIEGAQVPAILSKEVDILIGAVKSNFIVPLSIIEKAVAISQNILANYDADIIVYKKLCEFYGLAQKQIYNSGFVGEVPLDLQQTLSQLFVETLRKSLVINTPTQTTPINYRFTNFWVRVGKIVPQQTLLSKLYREKYMIQISKELLEPLLETSGYYIHFLAEETPFRQPSEDNLEKFVQFFNVFNNGFESLENSLFEHCNDGAIIVFPYYDLAKVKDPFTLMTFKDDEWQPKVVCYTDETILYQKMCNPAHLISQFYFGISLDYTLPLPPANCDYADIPACQSCNSEMECTKCMFGDILLGDSFQYYGRCECPAGEYKASFTTTTCNKTEYLEEAYQQFLQSFDGITELNDLFMDRAFMIVQLDSKQAYIDYVYIAFFFFDCYLQLDKLSTLPMTSAEQIQRVVSVLNVLSQGLFLSVEEYFVTTLNNLLNTIKENNYQMDDEFYEKLLLTGENIIIKLQNQKTSIKTDLHNLIYNDVLALYMNQNPSISELDFFYHKLYFKNSESLKEPQQLQFGKIYFELTEDIIKRINEECFSDFIFSANIMTIEGNPYDLIQYVSLLSGLAEFFCLDYSSVSSTAIDLSLSANSFYSVTFKDFSLESQIPACVQWKDLTWSSEGQIFEESYYQCTFEKLFTMAIIIQDTQQYLCDSKCATCTGYMHCTSCQSGYFLLQNYCYNRYNLPLDIILKTDQIVYLMNYKTQLCLLADTESSYSFQECDATATLYKKFQWTVQKNGIYYRFTNRYFPTLQLKQDDMEWFSLIKLADDPDYGDLYTSQVKLLVMNKETCIDSNFIEKDCSLSDYTLYWEFFPLSQDYHDAIDFTVEIEVQTDVVVIQFGSTEAEDIINNNNNIVYYLDNTYTENLDQLSTIKCSNLNTNSPVLFNYREKDVTIEASLSDLVECGYQLDTSNPSLITLTGSIMHVFKDTGQTYHSSLTVTMATSIEVQTNILNNAYITGVIIGNQGEMMLEQYFVASVSLANSNEETDVLEVKDIFEIVASLPSTIVSTYELTLPYTAKLANLYNNFDVPISLESSLDNQFTILVDASNIAEGSYRLKFTGTLILQGLTRMLESDPQAASLIIDKELKLGNYENKTNSNNNNNNSSSDNNSASSQASDISSISQNGIDESNDTGFKTIPFIIIIASCLGVVLLLGAIGYYARKVTKAHFQKQRQQIYEDEIATFENNINNEEIRLQSRQQQLQQSSKKNKKPKKEILSKSACLEQEEIIKLNKSDLEKSNQTMEIVL